MTGIADDAIAAIDPVSADVPEALNYCFFAGYSENVKPSSPDPYQSVGVNADTQVLISGPPVPAQDQFQRCLDTIQPLLVKYNNDYCNIGEFLYNCIIIIHRFDLKNITTTICRYDSILL